MGVGGEMYYWIFRVASGCSWAKARSSKGERLLELLGRSGNGGGKATEGLLFGYDGCSLVLTVQSWLSAPHWPGILRQNPGAVIQCPSQPSHPQNILRFVFLRALVRTSDYFSPYLFLLISFFYPNRLNPQAFSTVLWLHWTKPISWKANRQISFLSSVGFTKAGGFNCGASPDLTSFPAILYKWY